MIILYSNIKIFIFNNIEITKVICIAQNRLLFSSFEEQTKIPLNSSPCQFFNSWNLPHLKPSNKLNYHMLVKSTRKEFEILNIKFSLWSDCVKVFWWKENFNKNVREQWGRTSRNHCFISSTGQWVVLMKLRWMLDSQPQGSPGNATLTLTMRAPMSLTERCHFKEKLKKVKRIKLPRSSWNPWL